MQDQDNNFYTVFQLVTVLVTIEGRGEGCEVTKIFNGNHFTMKVANR